MGESVIFLPAKWEDLKAKYHFENAGVERRIILKYTLK
jgi:hypothetical protein